MLLRRRWLYMVLTLFASAGITTYAQFPDFMPTDDNNIRNYLIRAAHEISTNSLAEFNTLEQWEQARPTQYDQFIEMMGLVDVPLEGERPPLNVHVTGEIQQNGFRIIKLYYESLPHLYVPANLYIPDGLTQPAPAVLYVCGHSRIQKTYYQTHARRFAEMGFVCLITETIQWGEVQGHHWGTYAEGRFQWASKGYTPGGVELWNGMRGIDLLCSRPEVDPERIGVTGNSGGGAYSWYIAAADPRVKIAAPSCGTSTLESHIAQRTIDGHCDCMWFANAYQWDQSGIAALIAPRPVMIAATSGDGLNSIHAARQCYLTAKKIYALYGKADAIDLVEGPGGHGYTPGTRTSIYSFFLKHLMGKTIAPEEIADNEQDETKLLSNDELRAYVDGPPPDDITTRISETFIHNAAAPLIDGRDSLAAFKRKIIALLKEKSFAYFPEEQAPLDWRVEFQDEERESTRIVSFVSEPGYRLKVDLRNRFAEGEQKPVLLVLNSPHEARWDASGFASRTPEDWNRAFFAARGIGETAWGDEMQWHVRRAALWAGRTITSMRVYDVLRCLETMRRQPAVDGDHIAIAARGAMCVTALYAALLDGKVDTVLLSDPPETFDAPGAEDGRDESIEILNGLRIADLPQAAAALAPTRLAFIGDQPEAYQWTEQALNAAGRDNAIQQFKTLGDWRHQAE